MPGPEFFETRMGHAFYDGTMPKLADAMKRVASALEKLVELEALKQTASARPDPNLEGSFAHADGLSHDD
jgi:hypothetical protein